MKKDLAQRFHADDETAYVKAGMLVNLVPEDLVQTDVNPEFAAGWEACQGTMIENVLGVKPVEARPVRHGRLETIGTEEYYGKELRCSKCGTEFMLADGREVIACPHCAADLRPDEKRDRLELANAVLDLVTQGSCAECFGCWKRNEGNDETCAKCEKEKTEQAARLLLALLEGQNQ